MGIITLTLLSGGFIDTLDVPIWVKLLLCYCNGYGYCCRRLENYLYNGYQDFQIETINGFAADLNSAITIFTASFLHLPVSTTHVVSGSLLGVGSSKRLKAVNWGRSKIWYWRGLQQFHYLVL